MLAPLLKGQTWTQHTVSANGRIKTMDPMKYVQVHDHTIIYPSLEQCLYGSSATPAVEIEDLQHRLTGLLESVHGLQTLSEPLTHKNKWDNLGMLIAYTGKWLFCGFTLTRQLPLHLQNATNLWDVRDSDISRLRLWMAMSINEYSK